MKLFKKVFLTTLAAGALTASGCKKSDVIEQPKINKTLTFSGDNADVIAEPYAAVKQYNADQNVGKIYLKPEGSFGAVYFSEYLEGIKNTMKQSSKVQAAPNAEFTTLGRPLVVDNKYLTRNDSLEFTRLGYTFQKTL